MIDLVASGVVGRRIPLAPLTTYKLGGEAAFFSEPETVEDLQRLIEGFADREKLILGRGSNLVISDHGFDGLVIRLAGAFGELVIGEELVEAGAAVSLPTMARASVKAGRGGLEWCVGIPGSVGGAVRMNAGCHGSDVSDSLEVADVISLATGEVRSCSATGLDLRYRHSNLGADDVVVRATFRTHPIEPEAGNAELRRITQWRKEHQPGGTLNAGSVFKNPDGDAAGRLIDEAGLKGFELGGVRVSPRHANFFEAGPGATAQELFDLVGHVRRVVADKTGVLLEPELRFVGSFEEQPR